ncbi:MAG TPA: TIR domain-containing protein [Verrucomicrobiae bacterium]|jgi:hypothetical protein|nr:TIR domain-containing protein [Verrucomicrobiae bacterium]
MIRTFLSASPWVPQTVILVGIYVAIMAVATQWMPWHAWDMNFFAPISTAQSSTLDSRIVVVDVQSYSETENTSPQRSTIAAFLSKLASKPPSQHPAAVILDFNFDECAACARATAALLKSLSAARAAAIDLYAVEALPVDQNDVPGSLEPHDPGIYDGYRYLAGFGHTTFFVADSGVLISRDCYAAVPYRAPDSDTTVTQPLQSVTALVLAGFDGSDSQQATLPCDGLRGSVYVGPPLTRSPYSTLPHGQFYAITLTHPFPNVASLKNDYVIVGSVEHDRPILESNSSDEQEPWQRLHGDGSVNIGGPELVAWALSDARDAATMRGTQPVNGMLLLLAAAFSGITALAFVACFLLLKRLRLQSARRFLPWAAAVLGCCIGLGVFAAFEALMLGLGKIQPQVSLVSFAVFLAAGLSGVRGNQIVAADRGFGFDDEAPDYDIFISYAHGDIEWVRENVYEPFRKAKLPNGNGLEVFFDKTALHTGDDWLPVLSRAVLYSRLVVPVFSENYFRQENKGYCLFELGCAFRKWIELGSASRCLIPIVLGRPTIPDEYHGLQAISVADQPDIVEKTIAEIVERISREQSAPGVKGSEGGAGPRP